MGISEGDQVNQKSDEVIDQGRRSVRETGRDPLTYFPW